MSSKTRVKLVCLVLFIAVIGAMLMTSDRAMTTVHGYSSGPPDGKTGAPGEGTCADCHLNAGGIGEFMITAPSSYVPGQTYLITVTHVTKDETRLKWGFELTVLNSMQNFTGALQSLDITTQTIVNGGPGSDRTYIEHTSNGTFEGQLGGASWTFNWIAPNPAAGPVTFYAAGNEANGDGTNNGDQIYLAQAAVPVSTCSYSLSSAAGFFAMTGGPGSVNVISPSGCNWTAASNDNWITLTSSDTGSGNDTVGFEVRENFTASARTGTLTIAGATFTVVQDGGLSEACNFSIAPSFQSFPSSSGNGTIQVGASEQCAWQATTAATWITITSGLVGVGAGTVNYSLDINGGGGRKGTIIIAGKAFSVKQKGH